MSNGRLLAIGDIHGCSNALHSLLEGLAPGPDDTVVTLGDYIDRGPDSRGVVDQLLQLAEQTHLVPLIGNHEQMMLDVLHGQMSYRGWIEHGGVPTLDSYGFDGNLRFLPPAHQDFFESLVDYYETDTHFFLHANYDPDLPLDQQMIEVIRWRSLRDEIPGPHVSGRVAVVGHTANHDGQVLHLGHLIALDTYCYGGGVLTAIDVHTGEIWQASQNGRLVER